MLLVIMKTFLTILLLFFSSSVIAEKINLFCSDRNIGGFRNADNFNTVVNFNTPPPFKMVYDTNEKTINSSDLDFYSKDSNSNDPMFDKAECHHISIAFWDEAVVCTNPVGETITLNLLDYKYIISDVFSYVLKSSESDQSKGQVVLRLGTCQKF